MDTELLVELIERKRDLLAQLHQLGGRQMELTAGGEWAELMAILAAKQRLLAPLHDIERRLDAFRDQDPNTRTWSNPQARQRCSDMARRCETLLAELVQMEKQSEARLIQRRDQAASRLQGLHQATLARGAYADVAETTGRGLNLSTDG